MTDKELLIIEKYLDEELDQDEKLEFNTLMSGSEEFANEVKLQKSMIAYTSANLRAERKARMLADFRALQAEEAKVIPLWSKLRYFVAASIVLVIGFFIFTNYSQDPADDLYASYYRPYDGVVITRSDGDQSVDGLAAYYSQAYERALEKFINSEETSVITEEQRLLLIANCYLNLDQPDKSIQALKSISAGNNELIKDSRDWYLAMSYLKSEDIEQARSTLIALKDRQSVYSAKAGTLLEEDVFK
ncbi:MAG: hypothetical protein WBA74_18530 [Cyclobacteriaceae bacterium]